MDRTEHAARASDTHETCSASTGNGISQGTASTPPRQARPHAELSLVSGRLVLAAPHEDPTEDWATAIGKLVDHMQIDWEWVAEDQQAGLMTRAMKVMGGAMHSAPPVFAPWQCWSPTAFQCGMGARQMPRAQWIASYLFDSGAGRPPSRPSIDLVLMSPLASACERDENPVGQRPRIQVLNAMLAAAVSEGRQNLAIVVSEASRNTVVAQLVAADSAFARAADLEVEVLSIEQAVVRMQSGEAGWDAIIAMPALRGIMFGLLAEKNGIAGPWPMLWHDRQICFVSGEALEARAPRPLDATLLMQSLALVARQRGNGYVAERLHQAWSSLRDKGVSTPSRSSSAPYVNLVSEAEFIDLAATARSGNGRAVAAWKAIAARRSSEGRGRMPAQLSLVASR